MAAKLTRLTHTIAIQLQLVAESCAICSSHSRRPVRKILVIPSYFMVDMSVLVAKFWHAKLSYTLNPLFNRPAASG